MPDLTWLPIAIFAADWLIRLGLVVRVIMRRRSVATSLAWIGVLLFAPLVGIPIYLLIGENRLGRRRAAKYQTVAADLEPLAIRTWQSGGADWTTDVGEHAAISRFGTAATGLPPLKGNRLEILAGWESMLPRLVEDIRGAERRCHLVFYIWQPGGEVEKVVDALIDAAGRGLTCRVLVDAVGSAEMLRSSSAQRMRRAGVRVVPALPVSFLRAVFRRLDLRNHRKIAVIDGRVAYVGSQNLNDDTFGAHRRVGSWIDASVRIEGPGAQALEIPFLRDWEMDAPNDGPRDDYITADAPAYEGGSVVQVLPSGPGLAPLAVHNAVLTTIHLAREELILTTPYFVPDEAVSGALISAAMRGVAVTVIVPERIDSPLVARASRSHFDQLLDRGIRIARYNKGMLHAKTITIDRKLGVIGSANFDMRSFFLNFEVTLFVYDTDFASSLRWLQTTYLNDSEFLDPEKWRRRPFPSRFVDNTARLLGPLF